MILFCIWILFPEVLVAAYSCTKVIIVTIQQFVLPCKYKWMYRERKKWKTDLLSQIADGCLWLEQVM